MSLLNKKAVKEYVNTQLNSRLSESIYDTIDEKLKEMLNNAKERSSFNGRKILRGGDL